MQWPVALAVSALFALIVGALCLRTRGVYFIMITLAFSQLVYYFGIALDRYGGDDGLTLRRRSQFAGVIDLTSRTQFYYLCFVLLVGHDLSGLAAHQFALRPGDPGRALERRGACTRSASRPTATGSSASSSPARSAGSPARLLPNHTNFISPAMMHWTRSGDLIVMVVLGGMGSIFGPLIGAVLLLSLEEQLPKLIQFVTFPMLGPGRGQGLRILADRARPALSAGGAVCARRHRRPAGWGAPCLMRCCRSKD